MPPIPANHSHMLAGYQTGSYGEGRQKVRNRLNDDEAMLVATIAGIHRPRRRPAVREVEHAILPGGVDRADETHRHHGLAIDEQYGGSPGVKSACYVTRLTRGLALRLDG